MNIRSLLRKTSAGDVTKIQTASRGITKTSFTEIGEELRPDEITVNAQENQNKITGDDFF